MEDFEETVFSRHSKAAAHKSSQSLWHDAHDTHKRKPGRMQQVRALTVQV